MARGRFISRSIASNEQLAGVSLAADFLFGRCIPFLDGEGRMSGNPIIVKLAVQLRPEMTLDVIPALLAELAAARDHKGEPLVVAYEVGGQRVLYFPGFARQQQGLRKDREGPSRFPPPPEPVGAHEVTSTPAVFHPHSNQTPAQLPHERGQTPDRLQPNSDQTPAQEKLSEVKLREGEGEGRHTAADANGANGNGNHAVAEQGEVEGFLAEYDFGRYTPMVAGAIRGARSPIAIMGILRDHLEGMNHPQSSASVVGQAVQEYLGSGEIGFKSNFFAGIVRKVKQRREVDANRAANTQEAHRIDLEARDEARRRGEEKAVDRMLHVFETGNPEQFAALEAVAKAEVPDDRFTPDIRVLMRRGVLSRLVRAELALKERQPP